MASSTVNVLMKIGILSDEMTPPRNMTGIVKLLFSVIAVAYSYFFLHISFFGPPVEGIFRGTFFLGVAVMSLLLFKGRQQSFREKIVWLDEFFAVANLFMICGAFAILAHWYFGDQVELWRRYSDTEVQIVGLIGGLVGVAIYVFEGWRLKQRDGFAISDVVFLIGAIVAVLWWIINLDELRTNIGSLVVAPLVIFAVILSSVSFEIARRIVGPLIPFLGFLFFIYSFEVVGQVMPGILQHLGFRTARVMEFLMLSTEGMFGLITNTFATFIVIFVILGAFLEKTGLGAVIINTAYRLTGAKTGGPGLAAVISSGFFGMISGSGVANVMTTGTFTIPLMKRVGYRPEFAGGVEAAASTGGAYMPPIMGAGAFLLAELTETPYIEIITIAFVPALLYYVSVGLIVYFRAVRNRLHGVPVSELPPWSEITPRLHLLLPIPFMVYLLVIGDSPFLAAAKTIVVIMMLKAIDLLMSIPTSKSSTSWRMYLAISFGFAVLVYFFGMVVGAPFSWFVEDYVGIGIADAFFWLLFVFIILKAVEIQVLGRDEAEAARIEALHDQDFVGVHVQTKTMAGLKDVGSELVLNFWTSMEAGARNTLVVSCIAGVLGILLAAATQSALPNKVGELLVLASGGYLGIAIFFVIIAGYIVGMGLPIAASYVILAVFAVGALTDLGVPSLTAHMISYWVAVVSAVTPPVALAAYAASSIAQGDPVKTGNQALKLASLILITPYLFAYTPILLDGPTTDVVITVVASFAGVYAWARFLDGYGIGRKIPFERGIWLFAATCLLLPIGPVVHWLTGLPGNVRYEFYAVGAIVLVVTYFVQHIRVPKATG
jgi:TRAP transporter 4TM/12TM fusion protein